MHNAGTVNTDTIAFVEVALQGMEGTAWVC